MVVVIGTVVFVGEVVVDDGVVVVSLVPQDSSNRIPTRQSEVIHIEVLCMLSPPFFIFDIFALNY